MKSDNILKFIVKSFLTIFIIFIYSSNFRHTPDYYNYIYDWFSADYDLNVFSDPLSRFYYSLFAVNPFWVTFAISLPLALYIFFAVRFRPILSVMLLGTFPILYNSLINPRFFFSLTLVSISIGLLVSRRFVAAAIAICTSVAIHLAAGLFIPLLMLVLVRSFSVRYCIFLVFLCSITGILIFTVFGFQFISFLSLLEFRLEYAVDEGLGQSKFFLHFFYFVYLYFFFLMNKRFMDDDTCRIIYCIVWTGAIVLSVSFIFYSLIMSRLLHGLSVISIFFIFKHFRKKKSFSSSFFLGISPIAMVMACSEFYFDQWYMFGTLSFLLFFVVVARILYWIGPPDW